MIHVALHAVIWTVVVFAVWRFLLQKIRSPRWDDEILTSINGRLVSENQYAYRFASELSIEWVTKGHATWHPLKHKPMLGSMQMTRGYARQRGFLR